MLIRADVRSGRVQLALGGIGRVHVYRWGDGSGHFHTWFYPRPYGQLQLRGSFITAWEPLLADQPDNEVTATGARIAAAM